MEPTNKHILLTISILISNRPDTVRRCLDSVKPLLEQVSSELILTDTGCGSEVRTVIEEYTDQIIDFPWCRDFSAARNAGLERAKGKWFLYLDDDEWFQDVSPIVRFFNSGEYRAYGFGIYTQRNYMDFEGAEYADLLVSRMIRLEPDIRFVYRIHESFNRAPGLPKKLDAYVHHYGYVYQNEEERRAHAMRNISLLKEELEAEPRNMRHAMQLAQEYNSIGDREASLGISLDSMEKAETGPVENGHFLASLYANEVNCYIELGRFEDAIEKGERHLKSGSTDKLARALISGRLTTAYTEKADYTMCLERAEDYWKAYQEYRQDDEKFAEFETPVTNTCFHERRLAMIISNGARAAIRLGKDDLAWQWFRRIDWEGARPYADPQMVRDILERMLSAKEPGRIYYREMCGVLLEHEDWRGFVLQIMMDNCGQGGTLEDRIRAAAAYRDVAGEHWFLKLARLAAAAYCMDGHGCRSMEDSGGGPGSAVNDAPENPEEAERIAAEIWGAMEESMSVMKALDLPGAVKRLGGDNGHVLDCIPFTRWEKGVEWYFSRYAWEDAAWWLERFADTVEPDNLRMLVWRSACGISRASKEAAAMDRAGMGETASEDKADEGLQEKADIGSEKKCGSKISADAAGTMEGIMEGLGEYAACRTALCERIYRPEIIQKMPEMLPEEYRGAYAISSLLEMTEKQQYVQAVKAVREIKELLPGLSGIMRHYLIWLDDRMERQRQESSRAAGEFQVLARQIKLKVHELMEAGQYQAALGVTEQLMPLLPEDSELIQLREKILQCI